MRKAGKQGGPSTSEIKWTTFYNTQNVPMYMITSSRNRDKYHLYRNDGDGWERTRTDESPEDFIDECFAGISESKNKKAQTFSK